MEPSKLARLSARLKSSLAQRERRPLDFFRFAVPRLRDAVAMLAADEPIDELAARSCNWGTKSYSMASTMLGIAEKRPMLDGAPLPQWSGPVKMMQLCLDYPQQVLSIQPAYEKLLGQWPHHIVKRGDAWTSLRVMPVSGGDDRSKWSVIHFTSQKNYIAGTGARVDVVGFDEPPAEAILRELRKARRAGRRAVRLVFFTPTLRRHWQPLRDMYGDGPRSAIRRIGTRWAEVRWSYDEVADWLVSDAEKRAQLEDWATDPLLEARVHGDYVDTDNLCPFDQEVLRAMLADCVAPEERSWPITREVQGDTGLVKKQETARVLVLEDPLSDIEYYLDVDPSRGINDRRHDPGGILGSKLRGGEDVVLYEGYIGSYGLGSLAAGLGRQYNEAIVDPESTGGWSEGLMHGLADAGYERIARTKKQMQPGKWETRLGFETNERTRQAMISEIQAWIAAYRVGAPYAPCRFARVIETLMDTIMDEKGKVVAAPGYHDEFLILKGQSLRKCASVRRIDPNLHRPKLKPYQQPAGMTVGKMLDLIERVNVPANRLPLAIPKRPPAG